MREVRFYRTSSGHCPVEEFLDSLSGKEVQKVVWVLRLVEELESVPEQYFKKLSGTESLGKLAGSTAATPFASWGSSTGEPW